MVKLTPLILATLAVVLSSPEASAACVMSYCKDGAATSTPASSTSWAITNTSRQRLGDIYNPGHGRRLQIRDTSRRIIGYIERDGTVTNTHRQKVGTLDW
jgi:hypothetical protein